MFTLTLVNDTILAQPFPLYASSRIGNVGARDAGLDNDDHTKASNGDGAEKKECQVDIRMLPAALNETATHK